jgi:hypothetical protein
MRKYTTYLLLAGLVLAAGCSGTGYLNYLFFGGMQKTVKAEYRIPKGSTVAVMIYVSRDVQFEYPQVNLSLNSQVVNRLNLYLKGSHAVDTVDPRTVVRYQDDNLRWDSMPKAEVAKDLNADYLLFITLPTYTTRESGTMSLYQARIAAEVSLYDAKAEHDDPVWQSEDTIHVLFPEQATYEARLEPRIRFQAEQQLADKIARKFIDHKAPYDEEKDGGI